MATAKTKTVERVVLTLSEDEAAYLRAILFSVALSDDSFTDDDRGESEYDRLSQLHTDLYDALVGAKVPSTYDDLAFVIED